MDVTEAFCRILKEKKIKRSGLAEKMGKTKGYISQILNGGRNITLRTLSDIAYYLGYQVNIVFEKRIKKKEQDSIVLSWGESSKERLSQEKVHFADDYIKFENKLSRLAS
jgi:transcriptional regulator with XRE-family HTH domain